MDGLFTLMHKDASVAVISIDERGSITKVSSKVNSGLLPFGTGGDRNRLKDWWENRAVPISQGNVRDFLHSMGIPSARMYLTRNLGLSMSDCYWIKEAGSDLSWGKVNLFTNDFDAADEVRWPGKNRYAGEPEMCRFTPASSMQGELKKKWIVRDGARFLVKGNFGRSCQQSLNEAAATLLHKKQGFHNFTPYGLCSLYKNLDNEPQDAVGCYSRAFTNENLEFVSGYEVCGSIKKSNALSEYENFIRVCGLQGMDEDAVRAGLEYQILSDYIITNTDRHFNNFGILRDSNTLQFVQIAPIFDSGNSMFWNKGILELPHERADFKQIEVTSFRRKEQDLLKYVQNRRALNLGLLPQKRELEAIYKKDILQDGRRYQEIIKVYEKKIDLLDEFQRTGTIKYERKNFAVSGKSVGSRKKPASLEEYIKDNHIRFPKDEKKKEARPGGMEK